ncbi:HbrB-like-domain-containing protein [Pisolithus thermaeus]|nr:HbrB-like-domain-containing protein [Pisolithus thermaeus]
MPLGLPRRSHDNGTPTPIRSNADPNDHASRESERHGSTDHRRSASFNDAIPSSGSLFKGLSVFHHESRCRFQSKSGIDTYANRDFYSNAFTPPGRCIDVTNIDPFAALPQVQRQDQNHPHTRILGFFPQVGTPNQAKGSSPSKSNSTQVSRRELQYLYSVFETATKSRETTDSLMTSVNSSTTLLNKGHTTSPSKPSTARTYDAKLVTREMHRLGTLAGLSPALAPSLSSGPSTSTLTLPTTSPSTSTFAPSSSYNHGSTVPGTSVTDKDNPWGQLHVHVLPLFNEEPLRVPIEDLNALVKRHIQTVLAASPSRALTTLSTDARELIEAGIVTLNVKLVLGSDESLMGRLVEVWSFFWDHVLPYIEGVLLPLQTDPLLTSLHRTPKQLPSSPPTRQGSPTVDVRSVALCAFRHRVVMPLSKRLQALLSPPLTKETLARLGKYRSPRLQQMLLVLTSERRSRPSSPRLSPCTPTAQPDTDEAAISELLRLFSQARHNVHHQYPQRRSFTQSATTRSTTPDFSSARIPRDRRGRIGGACNMDAMILNAGGWTTDGVDRVTTATRGSSSALGDRDVHGDSDDLNNESVETPRIGAMESDREIPPALRPSVEHHHRASTGGWGLGAGKEEKQREEDDDDEAMDWDQAQAVVERMVGMKPLESPTESRRRAA